MKYAVIFLTAGLALTGLGIGQGGLRWLALWPGASFFWVGLAYAKLGPRVVGKQLDGTLTAWKVIVLLPYFLFAWGVWHLQRWIHCALGHGRAASVVAAVLMTKGPARDSQEAVELVRRCRPRIKLCRAQLAVLEEVRSKWS